MSPAPHATGFDGETKEQSGETAAQPQAQVTITVRNNGPYRVEGPITLVDADGVEYPVPAGKGVSLCRCGASTKKPFCDGTHSRMGFEAAERAVRQAEGDAPAA